PVQFVGVVGVNRVIGAPAPQGALTFNSWSDGNLVQFRTIATPVSDTTYTALFDGGPTTTTSSTSTTTEPSLSTTSTTTNPRTTSSTTVPTSSTTTTTATPSTTEPGSTTTTGPGTTSTSTSSTTSTLPPACDPAVTTDAVLCRIGALDGRVVAVTADLGDL